MDRSGPASKAVCGLVDPAMPGTGHGPAALTRQGDAAEPALLESGHGRRLRCFLYGAEGLTGAP